MIGRNNSIETSAKITAIRFTPQPRTKSEESTDGARDPGVIELIKKSRDASKTAINEAINIRLDAR